LSQAPARNRDLIAFPNAIGAANNLAGGTLLARLAAVGAADNSGYLNLD